MTKKGVLIGDVASLAKAFPESVLSEISDEVEILQPYLTAENWRDHRNLIAEAHLLLATWGSPKFDQAFLDAAPRLEAIFYAAGSMKQLVTPALLERGIVISSAVGANSIPVAEYTVSVIVLSLKQFWRHERLIREQKKWPRYEVPGTYRSTVGLVSLGAVGRNVAARLKAYEVEVIGYDPLISIQEAKELNVELVALKDLFRKADVVSIHTPLLPDTKGLINRSQLELMKPGATLINTSRGELIHEEEMCQVFSEREDLQAILDVLCHEPPDYQSAVCHLDNIILTPHISGSMGREIERMGRWMANEVKRYCHAEPLQHRLNPALHPPPTPNNGPSPQQ